jgi:hydrogenase maturation factor
VAVEFVHPVVMGKRALPAVSVTGAGAVEELRAAARAGDALVVVAPAASAVAVEAVRRAPAWGLTTVWIGAGPRPAPMADHLVWIDEADGAGAARHDGRLVLRYHVLWELTHVCFEHPGLLHDPAADGEDGICITCTDEGRPGEVTTLLGAGLVAVRTARGVETVDASLVDAVEPGDLLLVHAGTAIERLDGGDG